MHQFNKLNRTATSWPKIFLAFVLLWGLVFLFIFPRMGRFLVVEGALERADVIVVLMGSSPERELEAADVYHGGFSDNIIIVEFSGHNQLLLDSFNLELQHGTEGSVSLLTQLGVDCKNIHIIPGEITSTRGEAIALRNYLKERSDINSLMIISSPFHMRRAALLFKREFRNLEREVVIIPHPSSYGDYNTHKWYRHRQSSVQVLMEYLKLFNVLFGF